MKRLLRPFKRLQWKLTFSYALTTALVLLLIEISVVIAAFVYTNATVPTFLLSGLQQQAVQAAPYFVHNGTPDQKELSSWLSIPTSSYFPGAPPLQASLTVVNGQGEVIAATGTNVVPAGAPMQTQLPGQAGTHLQVILAGKSQGQVDILSNGAMVVIAPIEGSDRKIVGALVQNTVPHMLDQQNRYWVSFYLQLAPPFLLVTTIISVIVGTLFGFVTTRGFTRRFKRLSRTVDNWSQGNFSLDVKDSSGDEIGQLVRQLNHMAEQLQNLLQMRQKLATLEERNRLARDLHDSVKQQVFAVSMQVSTARALLGRDGEAARAHLTEAERLVRQAQQELTSLIRELRPMALEGKGLELALQEYVAQWSPQTGIRAHVQVEGEQTLPLMVEEALYRIAQEALSNVARHSKATTVQVGLTGTPKDVTLSIIDDGQGFDVTPVNGQGVGLLSMRERMQALDGEVHVKSVKGEGTTVIARCERTGAAG